MRLLCLPMLAALAACGTAAQPGVEVRTVHVPQPQPCMARSEIPEEPASVKESLTGDAETDIYVISASAGRLRIWGQTLHSAMVACADQPDGGLEERDAID